MRVRREKCEKRTKNAEIGDSKLGAFSCISHPLEAHKTHTHTQSRSVRIVNEHNFNKNQDGVRCPARIFSSQAEHTSEIEIMLF